MRHIHPFPARMAPEIALSKIETLPAGSTVLDPMCGSGMVLTQASRQGLKSIGFDLDPLARAISQTAATRVSENKVRNAFEELILQLNKTNDKSPTRYLPWIDDDHETLAFVKFWFAQKQENQLRELVYHLFINPVSTNPKVINLLRIAVSRLIITKEPKASLARDTAHSRPHRTIQSNQFDIFESLPKSLDHVLSALKPTEIANDTKTYLGDARRLTRLADETIDAIITSPPYLNAIDYMRGHRLSLVWWGYSLGKLRKIRAKTIGAERSLRTDVSETFQSISERLQFDKLELKNYRMLWRYFGDLCQQTEESARVLAKNGTALYVIGNSTLRGQHVENSELLKEAAVLAGLSVRSETTREIPDNRRYLPVTIGRDNSLASRMRSEHIIEFSK